jgi:hypothetical protein
MAILERFPASVPLPHGLAVHPVRQGWSHPGIQFLLYAVKYCDSRAKWGTGDLWWPAAQEWGELEQLLAGDLDKLIAVTWTLRQHRTEVATWQIRALSCRGNELERQLDHDGVTTRPRHGWCHSIMQVSHSFSNRWDLEPLLPSRSY